MTIQPETITPVTVQSEPVTVRPEPSTNTETVKSVPVNNSLSSSYEFYGGKNETISAANSSVKSSYTPYEQVNFHTELKDFEMKGDNLIIYSNTGSLTIANVRGQNMTYGDADGNVIGYSYVSGTSETIDRRNYSKFNVVIGADNSDTIITAARIL